MRFYKGALCLFSEVSLWNIVEQILMETMNFPKKFLEVFLKKLSKKSPKAYLIFFYRIPWKILEEREVFKDIYGWFS